MNSKLNFTSENLYKLLSVLRDNSSIPPRIVGGAVRDMLLDRKAVDIDIATAIIPEEVLMILHKNNIHAVPTGIKFGTVTAVFPGEHFEITTLREDIECDGRWVNVSYTDDFEKDAQRRDFTINALSYEPYENKLYDYFGGLSHLENKKVVFIGNAASRILEDYLRILRFFRFSIRYANKLDEDGFATCCAYKEYLLKLSKERITSEIDKIISLPEAYKFLSKIVEGGIFEVLIPKHHINVHNLERANDIFKTYPERNISIEGFYALLLCQQTKPVHKDILQNFRFSNKSHKKILQFLNMLSITNIDILISQIKSICYEYPTITQELLTCCYINQQFSEEIFLDLSRQLSMPAPIFPITAKMLMDIGYEGRELGAALNKLRALWQQSDYKKTTEELLAICKEL
ncbi:MAG: CCA tRNA nucleotidyltransferase [Rickettsiaceae bacterium]|nr:CCA tRNA nucleotidyltransferase [Rickettsiaceae bacterium]